MRKLLEQVEDLARHAGSLILDVYHRKDIGSLDVFNKSDNSPLTEADVKANTYLVSGLQRLFPDVPIISEESEIPSVYERQQWSEFWLVDPLDGTKEFIHRTGEFTVNVALIQNGKPVLGVVYAPLMDTLYAAINTGENAIDRVDKVQGGVTQALSVRRALTNSLPVKVVTSRRHGLESMSELLAALKSKMPFDEPVAIGSSLKHCLIAEGAADFYPRFGPTSHWDTAAAQAIVEAAGGHVVNLQWQPLSYLPQESLLNPEFFVLGDSIECWQGLI